MNKKQTVFVSDAVSFLVSLAMFGAFTLCIVGAAKVDSETLSKIFGCLAVLIAISLVGGTEEIHTWVETRTLKLLQKKLRRKLFIIPKRSSIDDR